MHVGLFGYGRSLGGVGGVTLPRAISFTAALYSIGIPPELLGLASLTESDILYVKDVYPSLFGDLRAALRFANERRVQELLGEPYLTLLGRFTSEFDQVHEGLTSAIWASVNQPEAPMHISHFIEEAAHLRRFLG